MGSIVFIALSMGSFRSMVRITLFLEDRDMFSSIISLSFGGRHPGVIGEIEHPRPINTLNKYPTMCASAGGTEGCGGRAGQLPDLLGVDGAAAAVQYG